MTLTKAERRILEIWFHHFYMWYSQNNARHNHEHFLMLPHLLQTNSTYNADIIESVWKDFILSNPTPPSEAETILAMTQKTKHFKCSQQMFKPFYKLKGINRRVKMQSFRDLPIQLTPKIYHETFHNHLLDYLLQICYTFSRLEGMIKNV